MHPSIRGRFLTRLLLVTVVVIGCREGNAVMVAVTHSRELAGRFPKVMRMREGELVNE